MLQKLKWLNCGFEIFIVGMYNTPVLWILIRLGQIKICNKLSNLALLTYIYFDIKHWNNDDVKCRKRKIIIPTRYRVHSTLEKNRKCGTIELQTENCSPGWVCSTGKCLQLKSNRTFLITSDQLNTRSSLQL